MRAHQRQAPFSRAVPEKPVFTSLAGTEKLTVKPLPHSAACFPGAVGSASTELWGARRHADLSEMQQFFQSESSRLTAESQSRGPVLAVPKAGVRLTPDSPSCACGHVCLHTAILFLYGDAESVLGKQSWDTPRGLPSSNPSLAKGPPGLVQKVSYSLSHDPALQRAMTVPQESSQLLHLSLKGSRAEKRAGLLRAGTSEAAGFCKETEGQWVSQGAQQCGYGSKPLPFDKENLGTFWSTKWASGVGFPFPHLTTASSEVGEATLNVRTGNSISGSFWKARRLSSYGK